MLASIELRNAQIIAIYRSDYDELGDYLAQAKGVDYRKDSMDFSANLVGIP